MLSKIKFKIGLIFILLISLISINEVHALNKNTVNIYFFHSNSCTHCQKEKKLLNELSDKYNNIKLYSYEISENDNQKLVSEVGKLYGIDINGVPVTIIGNSIYTGYNEEVSRSVFIKNIEYYSHYGYEDKVGTYLEIKTPNLYPVNPHDITLDEFMSNYKNYKLIFNLYTNDLSLNTNSIIIGLLLGTNIFILLGLLLIIFIYKKESQTLFKIGFIYIIISIILSTIYNNINNNIIIITITILGLIIYLLLKKKNISNIILSITISSLCNTLSTYLLTNYFSIFNNYLNINGINLLYNLIYYLEMYLVYFFILALIFTLIFILIAKKKRPS